MDWIEMTHPDVEGFATSSQEAFDEVWADKGWVKVDPKGDLSAVSRAEINQEAEKRGLDVTGAKNKAEALEALKEATQPNG